jgi:transmembrane sensor
MSNPERIGTLLFRYTRRELTRAEEAELSAWRSLSPKNEQLFQRQTDPEHIRKEVSLMFESRDYVLQKTKERYPGPWEEETKKPKARVYRIMRWAAIFVIVLGVGLYFLLSGSKVGRPGRYQAELVLNGVKITLDDLHRGFLAGNADIRVDEKENGELVYIAGNHRRAGKEKYNRLYTSRGGQFSLKLPDGTIIWVNAETSITFPANFSQDSIKITVEGEAYFEVAHDSAHIFIVSLLSTVNRQPSTKNGIQIKTTGAHFNIMSYADEPAIRMTLLEGIAEVRLDSSQAQSAINLSPGQQARVTDQKISVIPAVDGNEIIAWKNGKTFFRDAPIQTIMRTISRWYDVDVVYIGNIPDKHFNLNAPRHSNLSEVLSILQQQGIHVSLRGKVITISP